MPRFEYRAPVQDAMNWALHQQSLNWALTDAAEHHARNKYGPAFDDIEVDTSITREGDDFLITLTWPDDALPATRRVRVNYTVITHRSGTAELDIPTGANAEDIPNDHLNKYGTDLFTTGLPKGVTIHQWHVQEPGDHTIKTDWAIDVNPSEETP